MIRPFTILCFAAFAGAGAWLYHVKHEVATLDRQLRETWRQTEQARDRTSILRAEWALLNEPDRLRQVAQRHLTLEPMQPQQFTRLPDMVRRLPQAVAFAGAPNLFVPERSRGEAQVMLAAAQLPAPATAGAETAATGDDLPPPPPAAPPMLLAAARTTPAPSPATEMLSRDEAPAPQALAATLAAQQAMPRRAPPPVPARAAPLRDASRPAPAAQPAIHVAPARPAAPVIRTTQVTSPPQVAQPSPTFASALGSSTSLGRPMLAPPVPFSSANAATLNSVTR
ncbi:cell division protein FtsL [Roseomonas sp. F4]